MEKIILVNAVKTSSQPSSSEINEYGNGQPMQAKQLVLAKDKTTAITTNPLEKTRVVAEVGESRTRPSVWFWRATALVRQSAFIAVSSKKNCRAWFPGYHVSGVFPQLKHSRVERGKKKPLPFKLYPYAIRVQKNFCKFTVNALEQMLVEQKTVKSRICQRSLSQVVQTFGRSLLIVPQDASLVSLLIRLQQLADFINKKSRCKSNLMLMVLAKRAIALWNKSDSHRTQSFTNPSPT
jgi:hypothetical protein